MGIRGFTKNNKKSFKSQKSFRWQRMCKAEKKKTLPKETIEIENVHLFSNEKLKNKLKNPKNNIKISGKKLRRLTKRLNHTLRDKARMETEVPEETPKAKTTTMRDVDMAAVEEHNPITVVQEQLPHPGQTSAPVKSAKKKKKPKRKNKNKSTESSGEKTGSLFDTQDDWEDVDMGEG